MKSLIIDILKYVLPFEKYVVKHCSVADFEGTLKDEIDRTKLMDIFKKYVLIKSNDEHLRIKTNLGFLIKTQKYYFSKRDDSVDILARNNFLMIFMYLLFFIVFIVGLVTKIIQNEFIGIFITMIWFMFISILTNGIHKYFRIKTIQEIEVNLKKEIIRLI